MAAALLAMAAIAPAARAQSATGSGLSTPGGEAAPWASLQWRVIPTTLPRLARPTALDTGSGLLGPALVADLYLSPSGFGATVQGGLRATSGLVAGGRPERSSDPTEAPSTPLPYVGFGYAGLHRSTGWGVSADLGLVASTPAVARFGRSSFASVTALEDAVRDLRFTPVLRLGVSYAF